MMIFEIPPNFGEKRKKDFSPAKRKEKKRRFHLGTLVMVSM